MRKVTEILGMPVYDECQVGKQIGEVQEVLFDETISTLVGIKLKNSGWFSTSEGILFADVLTWGHDKIIIRGLECHHGFAEHDCYCSSNLLGKKIVTVSGRDLGMVMDIWVDERNGTIHSYQLSGSLIEDILVGRENVLLPHPQTVTQAGIIIPDPDGHIAVDQ